MAETLEQRQLREQEEAEQAVKAHDDETERMLGADKFVVTAPLVNIKVKDAAGAYLVKDHNEAAVLEKDNVEPANLRHLVDLRYLAPVDSEAAKVASPAGRPVTFDDNGMPVKPVPADPKKPVPAKPRTADKA